MEEGWICFEKIFDWAQISHYFISFYFILQQHWVNQRVFSAISCCALSFTFPCLMLCLLSWKAFLSSFFQPLPLTFFKKTHNHHTGQFRNFFPTGNSLCRPTPPLTAGGSPFATALFLYLPINVRFSVASTTLCYDYLFTGLSCHQSESSQEKNWALFIPLLPETSNTTNPCLPIWTDHRKCLSVSLSSRHYTVAT